MLYINLLIKWLKVLWLFIQEFKRKDCLDVHVKDVHLKQNTVECPQCGETSSRYYRGYISSNMSPRESALPVHFEGKHGGKFQATGKLSVCSRCGKVGSCTCKQEQEELNRRKMERRVQNELGLNRPTRRYCMNLCKIIRNVLTYSFQFELCWGTWEQPRHHTGHNWCGIHHLSSLPQWCDISPHSPQGFYYVALYGIDSTNFFKVIVLFICPSSHGQDWEFWLCCPCEWVQNLTQYVYCSHHTVKANGCIYIYWYNHTSGTYLQISGAW